MFATLLACGHNGRAVLRPIYDQASQTRDKRLLPSVRSALAFLSELLRWPGGLPPRTILFGAESRPTVKIWTNAMCEEGELSGVAWPASHSGWNGCRPRPTLLTSRLAAILTYSLSSEQNNALSFYPPSRRGTSPSPNGQIGAKAKTKTQGGCLSRRAWVRSASDMFNTTSAVKSPSGIKTFSLTAPPRSGTLVRSTY